jgi:hypothetical protein
VADPVEVNREDTLRLQVLLVRSKAIRIDQSRMMVHGLTNDGEQSVTLSPGKVPDVRYLRAVRAMLSSQAIDSPGGYPVFLKRWTRMGQLDSARLASLLKLGEPEAVIAVACAPSLTSELGRLAWWALPEAETARFLLEHENVKHDPLLCEELVVFLLDHLPFELDPLTISESVRLILSAPCAPAHLIISLWRKGPRKTSILLGFIKADPFNLPTTQAHADSGGQPLLPPLPAIFDAKQAALLGQLLSHQGQILLESCLRILERPADQEIVVECLETLARILLPIRPDAEPCESVSTIDALIDTMIHQHLGSDFRQHPLASRLRALWFLSLTGERLVRSYFARSSTVGSLMRKQLAPILDPVSDQLRLAVGGSLIRTS